MREFVSETGQILEQQIETGLASMINGYIQATVDWGGDPREKSADPQADPDWQAGQVHRLAVSGRGDCGHEGGDWLDGIFTEEEKRRSK